MPSPNHYHSTEAVMKLLWHWLVRDTLDVAVGLVQKVCLNCDESTCHC